MPFTIRPRIRRAFRLALRRRDLTDAEIDEELRFHIEMRIAQFMARGLTRDQADAEARRRFGESWDEVVSRLHDAGHLREEHLAMRERLDALWQDLAYAVRTLARQPGFALIVTLTFALGIGANATMFGIIDRLLLRPPPHVMRPEEVVELGGTYSYLGEERFRGGGLSYPFYTALRADTADFSDVTVSTDGKYTLGSGVDAEQIVGRLVSGSYFRVFETRPAVGRFFLPGEDGEAGGAGVVVLSHAFWKRRFGGDPSVLGKNLHIGPRYFVVVGIAPEGFTGPEPRRVDVWLPIGSAEGMRFVGKDWATTWDSGWLIIYARLHPGVPPATAAARAAALYVATRAAWRASLGRPRDEQKPRVAFGSILPSQQLDGRPEAGVSRLLVGVAVLVLLIACANTANLLLARGAERQREIAVRLALGVSRARLLRLLLTETIVLAVAGAALALVTAVWGVRLVHATLLADFAWVESALDRRLLGATTLLAMATIVIAGLLPAMRASTPNVMESLKAGGREGGVQHSRTTVALLVVQAALSVLLLVGAGLFVKSLRHAASLRLGYEPDRVVAATMDLTMLGYKAADRATLFRGMRDRVAAIPGVASAAISSTHPLHGWGSGLQVEVPGRDSLPQSERGGPYFNIVGGGYFATLGLRIVDGRPITDDDVSADARVAVVSEPVARSYWPRERAVGHCVLLDGDSTCTTIVGVAADARELLRSDVPRFLIYVPAGKRWETSTTILLARPSNGDPARLVEPIRRTMQSAAPNLPYAEVRTFQELLAPQIRPWKMGATLFTNFGALAVILAAVGLYGAVSYSVTQRGHEFGVRTALGAQVRDVVRLVMGQGMRAAAIGVLVGSVAALLLGRFVADLLFQTSPRNPVVFAAVAMLILLVAAAASFVPAWRAARVDPVRVLRGE